MKLRDFLVPAGIQLNLSPGEKSVVLRQVAEALTEGGIAPNATDLLAKLMEREGIRSTAIGNKIAVPHAEIDEVSKTILTVGICPDGTDFEAPDGRPVHLFLTLLGPRDERRTHLKILARIFRLTQNREFVDALIASTNPADLIQKVEEEEKKHT